MVLKSATDTTGKPLVVAFFTSQVDEESQKVNDLYESKVGQYPQLLFTKIKADKLTDIVQAAEVTTLPLIKVYMNSNEVESLQEPINEESLNEVLIRAKDLSTVVLEPPQV